MKYRYLGSSGLLMSRLTLGTMTFGAPDWGCDQKESHDIIKSYIDAGGIAWILPISMPVDGPRRSWVISYLS